MIEHVIKRNGEKVIFSEQKIYTAISNACDAINELDKNFINDIVSNITKELQENINKDNSFAAEDISVSVETIQDITEIELMKSGKYMVAREYIVYRDKKKAERIEKQAKILKKFENNTLKVTKRDGSKEIFDPKKIQDTFNYAIVGYEKSCSFEDLMEAFKKNIVDDINTSDINKLLIKTCIDLTSIENIDWLEVASRIALGDLYKKATKFRTLDIKNVYNGEAYLDLFKSYVQNGLYYKDFFNYYTEDDIKKAGDYIDKTRDFSYTYSTTLSLTKRYLLNPNKIIKELPQEMYMSVALFLAIPEEPENRLKFALKVYDQCSSQKISLPTPTLINARTNWSQLSSCFKLNLDDDLRAIYHGIENMAQISKFGGGIGVYLGHIRSQGSQIRGFDNASGGTMPFIKVINDTAIAVNQLGARLGAISVTLDVWHRDIYDFLDMQTETGDIRSKSFDVFPAITIPDLFIERMKNNESWTLVCPYEVEKVYGKRLEDTYGEEFNKFYLDIENNTKLKLNKKVEAKDLFKTFLKVVVETGMPYVSYRDTVNKLNPNKHAGMIYNTNLCVTGDTRISTEYGLVTMHELYEKQKETEMSISIDNRTIDMVHTDFGTTSVMCNGIYKTAENVDIYEIVTDAGYKIKATEWHKFYRLNKNYGAGDRIKSVDMEKVSLNELAVGDILLTQSGEGTFGKIGTYEEGFIMGLVTGDGTFSVDNRYDSESVHSDTLLVRLYNQDMSHEKLVVDCINHIEELYSSEYSFSDNRKKEVGAKVNHRNDNYEFISIGSKKIARILNDNYLFNSNSKYSVPNNVFKGTKELVIGYLQGLFIADGTVQSIQDNNNPPIASIQLSSISRDLVEGVQLLLSNFGIKSSIYNKKRSGSSFTYTKLNGEIMNYISKDFYRIDITGDNAISFYEIIGIPGYKNDKLAEIIRQRLEMGFSAKGAYNNSKNITKIKNITYIGKDDVYDTTQEDYHSLILNGIVTGNCTEIQQNTSTTKFVKEVSTENGNIVIEYKPGDAVVCNLASINVAKVYTEKEMKETFPIMMRVLDNVITLNYYPIEEARRTSELYRPIGIGYLGLAEYLATHKMSYDTEEARNHVAKLFDKYAYYTYYNSVQLSKERGKYGLYEGSEYDKGIILGRDVDWYKNNSVIPEKWSKLFEEMSEYGTRFGYHSAPAPNTSTSGIVGTTAALLPIYKKYFVETNLSSPTIRVAPKLSPENFWLYKEYTNMDMNDVIDMIATIAPWIDQSISFEWMIDPAKVSPVQLYAYYLRAWEKGIKTVYYVRSLSSEVSKENCVSCSG